MAALVAALAACTAAPNGPAAPSGTAPAAEVTAQVPAAALTAEVGKQLQQQKIAVDAGSVSCPQGLPAAAGQAANCQFTVAGQPVRAVGTVTRVAGATVDFDITVQALPVPRTVLATVVRRQIAGLGVMKGVPIDAVTCAADLPATVGEKASCEVTSGSERATFVATSAKIVGGLITVTVDS